MKQKRANGRPQLQAVPPTEAIDLELAGFPSALASRRSWISSTTRSGSPSLRKTCHPQAPRSQQAEAQRASGRRRPLHPGFGSPERRGKGEQEEEDGEFPRRRFFEWRDSVVGKTDGIELNIEGVKFRLTVEIPPSDDFDQLKNPGKISSPPSLWEQVRTDLFKLRVPSRWFAEPRVSSKPSMLVTHTIFQCSGRSEMGSDALNAFSGLGLPAYSYLRHFTHFFDGMIMIMMWSV
ncbi:unnamed protein product [Spirodela intermedia]|uniref:Uncharacterized protein n=1 Tax=Spirodela intermedia TaxID=51605 RepID=A0A7I8IYP0_SPIIN|nr:unnamed protein product [Spirodela intermedia]CAA6662988.1 unnamed protein product [Spirodela intermedia]